MYLCETPARAKTKNKNNYSVGYYDIRKLCSLPISILFVDYFLLYNHTFAQ